MRSMVPKCALRSRTQQQTPQVSTTPATPSDLGQLLLGILQHLQCLSNWFREGGSILGECRVPDGQFQSFAAAWRSRPVPLRQSVCTMLRPVVSAWASRASVGPRHWFSCTHPRAHKWATMKSAKKMYCRLSLCWLSLTVALQGPPTPSVSAYSPYPHSRL